MYFACKSVRVSNFLTDNRVATVHHTRVVVVAGIKSKWFEEVTKKKRRKKTELFFPPSAEFNPLCFWFLCQLREASEGLDTKTRQPRRSYYSLGNAVNFTSLHLTG